MNDLTAPEFDRKKNAKAAAYTGLITGLLLLIFITVTMAQPQEPVTPPVEFIEVELEEPNIGSSDFGSGNDQPLIPDDAGGSGQSASAPATSSSNTEDVRDFSTDEKNNDAPPVSKPPVSNPNATKIADNNKPVKTPAPAINPTPPTPKPKAQFSGPRGAGNGNGNEATTYKPGSNEGIAGGNGDQGVPNGSPTGKKYTGIPRNHQFQIVNIPNQSFEDDFNQNGKVVMDIVVDPSGKVTSASYQPRGSNITEPKYKEMARRAAMQLKMPKTEGGMRGPITFNFKVQG